MYTETVGANLCWPPTGSEARMYQSGSTGSKPIVSPGCWPSTIPGGQTTASRLKKEAATRTRRRGSSSEASTFGARFAVRASPPKIRCWCLGLQLGPPVVRFYPFSPTAESFGVSAQIGSGVVRGDPELRFHQGSTRVPPSVPPGFHQDSTRVPPGFHQGSTRVPPGFHQVPPGFHQASTRLPPGFHQASTRFCKDGVVWNGLR